VPDIELSWQAKIILKVEQAGGAGFKCAAKFVSGYPDLAVALPTRIPTLIEVKMGVCVVRNLQRIKCRELRRGGFRVIGICILAEGKNHFAIKFDPESTDGAELLRVPFDQVVRAIWEDTRPPVTYARRGDYGTLEEY
jgi:hypothetical protein